VATASTLASAALPTTGGTITGSLGLNSNVIFDNDLFNRKLVLYNNTNDDHGFCGLGTNASILRYQVPLAYHHAFYSGLTSNTSSELMRITGTGNVGIGLVSPSYKLHVNGTIYAVGDITAFSDARSKTALRQIDGALDKIDALHGYTYERTDEGFALGAEGKRYAGVLAQEVQQVLPEVVYTDNDGSLSVAYGNLVSLLIQGIKELRQEVAALRAPPPPTALTLC
jgi:hypothetical protein